MSNRNLEVNIEVTENGQKIPKVIKFCNIGVKLFFNAQHIMIKLKPKERCFYDFLCERMDMNSNVIYIDVNLKNEFLLFLVNVVKQSAGQLGTLDDYLKKFTDLALILPTTNRGLYHINPKYVFKGSENARKNCIRKIIDSSIANGSSMQGIINVPMSDF